MNYKSRSVLLSCVLILGFSGIACAEVVYDSITPGVFGGGFGLANTARLGQVVTLGGQGRTIIRFEIIGEGFAPPPFDATLDWRLRFHALGQNGLPMNDLWTSDIQISVLPARVRQALVVQVPPLQVPNSFAWSIEPVSQSNSPGFPFADSPAVGIPGSFITVQDLGGGTTGEWIALYTTPDSSLGVRLIAVPEPKGIAFAYSAAFFACLAARAARRC